MNSATVTVRELKNKDTGIDITVPVTKETKGLLQSTFEFYVVVVSKLPYFKKPKHKESDVVQFMVTKKFNDFHELHAKLNEKYSATVLPLLPKKSLIVNEAITRERRLGIERFMHFLASTPKLCTSSLLLEFLGVNSIKAGKFRKDENVTETVSDEKDINEDDDNTEKDEIEPSNLFDEEEEEQEDQLFSTDSATENLSTGVLEKIGDESLRDKTKLFEDQDFGGGIEADKDDDLFLVPGATDDEDRTRTLFTEEDEENSDLLNIEDDIENIFEKNLSLEKKESNSSMELPKGNDTAADASVNQRPKPAPRSKPKTSQKPVLSQEQEGVPKSSEDNFIPVESSPKPKPTPRPKPNVSSKPAISQKPKISPKPMSKEKEASSDKENVSSVDNLMTDDIMKYIQQNTSQDDDDLDLFS